MQAASEPALFLPARSFLHRANPTAKILVFAVACAVAGALIRHLETYIALALALVAVLRVSGIKRRQLAYFYPAASLLALVALSWLFVDRGGELLLRVPLGPTSYVLRSNTVEQAASVTLRAMVWVLAYMALLTTTSSRELVAALEQLRVPSSIATAVGMLLKFWSLIVSDTRHIADAQRVRGLETGRLSLRNLPRYFKALAIPTIFLMLKRFRTLSYALALRGYGNRPASASTRTTPVRASDLVFTVGSTALLFVFVAVDWLFVPAWQ